MSSTYMTLTGNDTIHVKSRLPANLKCLAPTKASSWGWDEVCLTPRNDDNNLQPLKLTHKKESKSDVNKKRGRTKSI